MVEHLSCEVRLSHPGYVRRNHRSSPPIHVQATTRRRGRRDVPTWQDQGNAISKLPQTSLLNDLSKFNSSSLACYPRLLFFQTARLPLRASVFPAVGIFFGYFFTLLR